MFRWYAALEDETLTEYVGVKLGDYHRDPAIMLDTQLRGREMFQEKFGYNVGGPYVASTSYVPASTLGAEVYFPEDDSVQVHGRVLKSIEDVDHLRPPEKPLEAGLVPRCLRFRQKMSDLYKDGNIGYSVSFQGPITTAVILRGHEFYSDLYDDPDRVHRLLDIVTDNNIRLAKAVDERFGTTRSVVGIGDDYGGLISAEQYEEFAYPYMLRIYEAYPEAKRYLHCETLTPDHLGFIDRMGICHLGPGIAPTLNAANLKSGLLDKYGIEFDVQLPPGLIVHGTPEELCEATLQAVRDGADQVGLALCMRGIPAENIKAFVDLAKALERGEIRPREE